MKIGHLICAIVFALFAIVQWNDPDSLLWIIMYALVAVVAFLAWRNQYYFFINLIFTLVLLVATVFYVPDVISWFQDGMPSITDSMKASSPYIELVREFFGLMISLVAMSFYLVRSKNAR